MTSHLRTMATTGPTTQTALPSSALRISKLSWHAKALKMSPTSDRPPADLAMDDYDGTLDWA